MKTDERIKQILAGKIPDRVPICEISFWPKTIERWKKEGLPDGVDLYEYLGIDKINIFYYNQGFYFDIRVLEQTYDYTVYIDAYGRKIKQWSINSPNYGVPHVIEYPLKSREDWKKMKGYLSADEKRIPEDMYNKFLQAKSKGTFTALSVGEPTWFIIERTFGFENGLPFFIEEKDLVSEIIETVTNFNLEMTELILNKGIKVDAIWTSADLCYKNGMLFSPKVFRDIVLPYYRNIKDFCNKHGLFWIFHCDGYVKEFIPFLIEAGVDAIQPLEARCGNNLREYKKLFGDKITLFGNISTEILSSTKDMIRNEIESKLRIAMEKGRYIFHSDHSIPHTVPFDNYKYAIELAKKIGKYRRDNEYT